MEQYKIAPLCYGVVIIPPPDIAAYAADQARLLDAELARGFGGHLDSPVFADGALPHVTLFQGGFPEGVEADINEALGQLAKEAGSVSVAMEPVLFLHPYGPVFWIAETTAALAKLHERSLELLSPLTKQRGIRLLMPQWSDRLQKQNDLTEKQKQMVRENGFAESGELFLPHITLGRIAKADNFKNAAPIVEAFGMESKVFPAGQIRLGKLGYAGNVEAIL
jgi:2'-5' RNA ligase